MEIIDNAAAATTAAAPILCSPYRPPPSPPPLRRSSARVLATAQARLLWRLLHSAFRTLTPLSLRSLPPSPHVWPPLVPHRSFGHDGSDVLTARSADSNACDESGGLCCCGRGYGGRQCYETSDLAYGYVDGAG